MTTTPSTPSTATTSSRRVVVTGLGATTPLGGDVRTSWEAALAGRSGARPITDDWINEFELPVTFAATAAVRADSVLERREIKRLDPSQQFAVIAAREAWADAGSPEVDPLRLGSVVATGIGGIWTLLTAYDTLKEKGARRVLPLTVPMLMANGPTAAISIEFTARAGAHTPVSACASGAEAIAYGAEMIRSGRADIVICGGTEAAIHPLPIASFTSMHAMSKRQRDPERASRPSTPPATASSSARAPASSSWSPRSTPRPAGPASTPTSWAPGCRPTPTTSPPPSPRVRASAARSSTG